MARALCTAIDTEWGEVLLRVAVRAAMVQYRDICCEIATVLNSLSLSLRDSISKISFSSSSSFFLLFIIINATFLPFSYVQNSRTRIEFIPIIFSLVFLEDRLITVENSLPCF